MSERVDCRTMKAALKKSGKGFLPAFVSYLEALQSTASDRLIGRENKATNLGEAGKRLVGKSSPKVRKLVGKLTRQVAELEARDCLISQNANGLGQNLEAAKTLGEFRPYLEKIGLALYADVWQDGHGKVYLDVCLGEGVRVRDGCLDSTIFVKKLVETATNRLLKEKGAAKAAGHIDMDGRVWCDFEASMERGQATWKRFRENGKEEGLEEEMFRKLAYGKLFERFGENEEAFSEEFAFLDVDNTISHEFHHQNVVRYDETSYSACDACAYLYSVAEALSPEAAFAGVHVVHRVRNSPDWRYRAAAELVLEYLGKAGYTPSRMRSGKETAGLAKKALGMLKLDYGLTGREDAEKAPEPDFKGYSSAVREAVKTGCRNLRELSK